MCVCVCVCVYAVCVFAFACDLPDPKLETELLYDRSKQEFSSIVRELAPPGVLSGKDVCYEFLS